MIIEQEFKKGDVVYIIRNDKIVEDVILFCVVSIDRWNKDISFRDEMDLIANNVDIDKIRTYIEYALASTTESSHNPFLVKERDLGKTPELLMQKKLKEFRLEQKK